MTMQFEPTIASKQFSHEELKQMFDGVKQDYNNDFVLMFMAMHLETMERCAQLEMKIAKLELKKK